MSKENNIKKVDAFLIWLDNKMLKSNEYDLLDYGQIAEIASREFGHDIDADLIDAALRQISRRKNYYLAPFAAGDSPPPAGPAEPV